jgi:8-oxo-dGTP diphosphatase
MIDPPRPGGERRPDSLADVKMPRQVRGYAYQMFYRTPGSVRRRIVRLIVPKYLIGAVNVIKDSEAPGVGRLLLLRQPPGRRWGLPAGLLKRHEPPAVAAARELFEESGIVLDPDDLVPAVPNAIVHTQGWVDTVFFGAVPASTTRLVVDGGEVLEAAWFPLDELPPLTSSTAALLSVYGMGPWASNHPQ